MERKVIELRLDDVLPNRFQPRIKFNEESINELAESIKEHGVIQPIVVRKIGDKYEIIAGERRYKASVLANKSTIPAIVTDLNDEDSAEVALIENIQRRDLTPIEEAISYKKILDMGNLTQTDMATKLGKTQSTIANKLRLLNLEEEAQEALLNEQISERHARSLLRLTDVDMQRKMLNKIIDERLTVRRTDEEIDKMLNGNSNDLEFLNVVPETTEAIPELNLPNNNVVPTVESLNIPTAPIIENNIPEMAVPEVSLNDNIEEFKIVEPIVEALPEIEGPTPVMPNPVQLDSVNPGFMNINKIEEEAEQIYVPKPLADVDSLLSPSEGLPLPIETPIVPLPPIATEEEDDDGAVLVPGKFFNILPEENKEETPAFEYKPLDTSAFNSFNFDLGTSSLPEAPVVEPVSEENHSFTSPEASMSEFSINPIPMTTEAPLFQPTTEVFPEIEGPTSVMPTVEVPMVNSMAEAIPNYGYVAPVSEPIVEETLVSVPVSGKGDLREVINIIRQCSSTIEQLGYTLDLEEFDFEDMYQVILKINK